MAASPPPSARAVDPAEAFELSEHLVATLQADTPPRAPARERAKSAAPIEKQKVVLMRLHQGSKAWGTFLKTPLDVPVWATGVPGDAEGAGVGHLPLTEEVERAIVENGEFWMKQQTGFDAHERKARARFLHDALRYPGDWMGAQTPTDGPGTPDTPIRTKDSQCAAFKTNPVDPVGFACFMPVPDFCDEEDGTRVVAARKDKLAHGFLHQGGLTVNGKRVHKQRMLITKRTVRDLNDPMGVPRLYHPEEHPGRGFASLESYGRFLASLMLGTWERNTGNVGWLNPVDEERIAQNRRCISDAWRAHCRPGDDTDALLHHDDVDILFHCTTQRLHGEGRCDHVHDEEGVDEALEAKLATHRFHFESDPALQYMDDVGVELKWLLKSCRVRAYKNDLVHFLTPPPELQGHEFLRKLAMLMNATGAINQYAEAPILFYAPYSRLQATRARLHHAITKGSPGYRRDYDVDTCGDAKRQCLVKQMDARAAWRPSPETQAWPSWSSVTELHRGIRRHDPKRKGRRLYSRQSVAASLLLGLSDATPTLSSTTLAIATRSDKLAHAQHAFQPSYENLLIPPQLRSLPADCEISMPPAMWFGSDGNVLANYADDLVQWFRSKPWHAAFPHWARPSAAALEEWAARLPATGLAPPTTTLPDGDPALLDETMPLEEAKAALHRGPNHWQPSVETDEAYEYRLFYWCVALERQLLRPLEVRDGTPGVSAFGVLPWVPVQGEGGHLVTLGLNPPGALMEAVPQGDFARLQNPAQGLYTAEGGFFVLGERDCFKFPIERWMGAVWRWQR